MTLPLAGIRVVEIASFVAVPAAGALLADLGAEVIKVEVPWGEIFRHSRPKLAGFENDFPAGPPFQMDNRGKRSLAIDLALPQAREALSKVIARADIVLTNVLPERLSKYQLDPERLRAECPELIVGRVSGYGADGPRADDPAFDYTAFWALSGLMDSMRDPAASPAWMRPGVGDHSAALALVAGILAALRTRDAGGGGQVVDVTLQHVGYYINGNDTAYALVTNELPPRHDRKAPRNPLWNHYPCRGGAMPRRAVPGGPLALPRDDRFGSLLAGPLPRPRSRGVGDRSALRRRSRAFPEFEGARGDPRRPLRGALARGLGRGIFEGAPHLGADADPRRGDSGFECRGDRMFRDRGTSAVRALSYRRATDQALGASDAGDGHGAPAVRGYGGGVA